MRFTVRRPPTGEVSPCCHRPSGGDVACSVDVGVAPSGSAGFALEDRLALAVSGSDVPARGASLRRVRGRDLLDPAESLVLQTCDELAPATSADRAVEPTLLGDSRTRLLDGAARGAGHRPHIEGLDPDHVEPPREVGGGLLDPVLAPIPLAGFQLRDRPFRLARGGWSRAWHGRAAAATPSTASTHPGSDRVRAAVHRSTAQPTRQRRGRCRPRCRRPDRRSGRGCGRTRHASGQRDHG